MPAFFWTRISRIANITVFFTINIIQMAIVSWIHVDDASEVGEALIRILGFKISFTPLENISLTIIFIGFTLALQIIILIVVINIVFSNKHMIQIYPIPLYGPAYSEEEKPMVEKVHELVIDEAKKLNIKVKKIFIYKKSVPNAFSLDLLPFPFLSYPYVVLNSNVLDVLEELEIRSVIAHELAHVKNGDSFVRLVLSVPRIFLNIAFLMLYLQIITRILDEIFVEYDFMAAVEKVIFLIFVYFLVSMLSKVALEFLYTANHQSEFLADYQAAKFVGPHIIINALIRLGQRNEAMEILSREINWLESLGGKEKADQAFLRKIHQRFPKEQISEEHAREIAPRLFIEQKLFDLKQNYGIPIETVNIDFMTNVAVPHLIDKRKVYYDNLPLQQQETRPENLKDKTIDWRFFDKDGNLSLEESEIGKFMESLIKEPNKMVFEHELFEDIESDEDHPSYRDRIISVYKFFYKVKYKEILDNVKKAKVSAKEIAATASEHDL